MPEKPKIKIKLVPRNKIVKFKMPPNPHMEKPLPEEAQRVIDENNRRLIEQELRRRQQRQQGQHPS